MQTSPGSSPTVTGPAHKALFVSCPVQSRKEDSDNAQQGRVSISLRTHKWGGETSSDPGLIKRSSFNREKDQRKELGHPQKNQSSFYHYHISGKFRPPEACKGPQTVKEKISPTKRKGDLVGCEVTHAHTAEHSLIEHPAPLSHHLSLPSVMQT